MAKRRGLGGSCVTAAADRAYSALQTAAERIARNQYAAGNYRVQRRHGRVTRGYSITPEHKLLVDMMPQVCAGRVSPNDAMALLHEYDVMKQRLGRR